MADDVKYAGLPICNDVYEGYSYRAIHPQSVVKPGSIPDGELVAPTSHDLQTFSDYYQSIDFCRIPATGEDGDDKLFLTFPFKFEVGGQDHPYPDTVPACREADTLFRAAAAYSSSPEGERDEPMLLVLHEDALVSPKWTPITDGNVDALNGFLSDAELDSICQKRISDNPERHGVFFVEKQSGNEVADPFEKISDDAFSNDIDSQMALYEGMLEAMPSALKPCTTSMEEMIHLMSWGESIRETQLAASDLNGGLYIRDILAPELSIKLVDSLGLYDIDGAGISTLEEIVSFAIERGLGEEEIGKIAAELADTYENSQQIIHGLFAVVSLRIGRTLHRSNEDRGGISDDFEDFASTVEKEILDGSIGIRIRSVRDIVKSPTSFATYNSKTNEIAFPPIDSGASPSSYFKTIIHECYHAYQDIGAGSISISDMEEPAYTRGLRAKLLLGQAMGSSLNPIRAIADLENSEYMNALYELPIRGMECHGMPQEVIELTKEFDARKAEALSAWTYAVEANLLRGADYDEHALFIEYYRMENYNAVMSNISQWSTYSRGNKYDACVNDRGAEKCNSEFLSLALERHLDGYAVFPESPEGAAEVGRFLARNMLAMANVFYADRLLWREMLLNDTFDRESAMDALLHTERTTDGI